MPCPLIQVKLSPSSQKDVTRLDWQYKSGYGSMNWMKEAKALWAVSGNQHTSITVINWEKGNVVDARIKAVPSLRVHESRSSFTCIASRKSFQVVVRFSMGLWLPIHDNKAWNIWKELFMTVVNIKLLVGSPLLNELASVPSASSNLREITVAINMLKWDKPARSPGNICRFHWFANIGDPSFFPMCGRKDYKEQSFWEGNFEGH